MLCTIMTPTYNRGYTLQRLYLSLLKQTNKNFEWLVIDDGSTDETESLIFRMIEECTDFPIYYYKKENGGKHTAINFGIDKSKGEIFFIVDSDDYLPENSIEIVFDTFKSIANKKNYAGIGGLRFDPKTNSLIGDTFVGEYLDCKYKDRNKNNIKGDKAEVWYTEILKKYKFPLFENEKFLSEAVVWYRMSKDGYSIRWINSPIYYCKYLDDGLTKNIFYNYSKSPKGFALYLKTIIENQKKFFFKKYYYYGLYIYLTKLSKQEVCKIFNISCFTLLLGILFQKSVYIMKGRKR